MLGADALSQPNGLASPVFVGTSTQYAAKKKLPKNTKKSVPGPAENAPAR
jgi:hypothetical protein